MNNDIDNELARLEEALKESDPELAKQLEALTAEADGKNSAKPATDAETENFAESAEDAETEDFAELLADMEELDDIPEDADTVPEESPQAVPSKKKKKKSFRGLLIYNAIIIAGIIGVLIFWYIRYNALFL